MNSGELKVDVPLAATEESDCDESSGDNQPQHTPARAPTHFKHSTLSTPPNSTSTPQRLNPNKKNDAKVKRASPRFNIDTGGDSVTGSLEDLVTSFDEKITLCFRDYQEEVEKIGRSAALAEYKRIRTEEHWKRALQKEGLTKS